MASGNFCDSKSQVDKVFHGEAKLGIQKDELLKDTYKNQVRSFELFHELGPLVFQLIKLDLKPLEFFHLLEQRGLLGTDVELYDLHL